MTDILLAACNGALFLREQLASLLVQTERDFRVLIQDDGSADGTPEILKAYAQAHPDRIFVVQGPPHEKSARGNFMSLLARSDADYVMFCDQDDVWDADKVALSLIRMREGEERYGGDRPLLVHTDLRVADAQLRPIAKSFMRYQKLDALPRLNRLLAQNSVTGCAMMINRPLKGLMEKAKAGDMLMHDWWAALCAAAMGEILFVDRQVVSYRQHGGNQVGAAGFNAARGLQKAAAHGEDVRQRLQNTYRQAEAFLNCYRGELSPNAERIMETYASLPQMPKAARVRALLRHGYLKKGFLRSLGQLYYC